LKELKIRISNQEGLEKATPQCDQMLECLKVTNGHATRNILKKCQSLIDGPSIPIPKSPSSNWFKPIIPTSYTNPSLYYTPFGSDGEKSMTKSEMLQS
jgi:hypothetical protein